MSWAFQGSFTKFSVQNVVVQLTFSAILINISQFCLLAHYFENIGEHTRFCQKGYWKFFEIFLLTNYSLWIFTVVSHKMSGIKFEIKKVLLSLNFNKFFGLEGIPTIVLKNVFSQRIEKPVCSLSQKKILSSNYKHILLLSIVSKVMELSINRKILRYLEKYKVIYDRKYDPQQIISLLSLISETSRRNRTVNSESLNSIALTHLLCTWNISVVVSGRILFSEWWCNRRICICTNIFSSLQQLHSYVDHSPLHYNFQILGLFANSIMASLPFHVPCKQTPWKLHYLVHYIALHFRWRPIYFFSLRPSSNCVQITEIIQIEIET